VLTNRSVYSAANQFAVLMHALPNVTLVGDHTGGGSGMPMNNSLPNGWNVRFSACPLYDKNGHHTEFGIDPDVKVELTDESTAKNIDNIIEKARKIINE
jgi:C-terminal processing protease CtpA/Prc